MEDDDVPPWLGIGLITTVVGLEDGRHKGLANASGGHFTEASLVGRLRTLGARPISRQGGEISYQVLEETADRVVAVAAAEAEPQDVGMLMSFAYHHEARVWFHELLEIDWAEVLFRRNGAPVKTIMRSDRGM